MSIKSSAWLRPRTGVRWLWREYTRMRTAIFLLIGVAILVALGGVIPQDQTSTDQSVQSFLDGHGNLNVLTSAVGLPLTEIFVSPFFFTLVGLLYVSLGACVLRRFRALMIRTVRHYARSPQFWGEWGSWVFHAAFFVLLVAGLGGKALGFQGLVAVTTGQTFTDTRSAYDSLQEGFLFNGKLDGFQLHLNSFNATYQADGEPAEYEAGTTLSSSTGKFISNQSIQVNDFLAYQGEQVYLMDYGWAPDIVVRDPAGQVVYSGTIQFLGSDNDSDKSSADGVLKVPDFDYSSPTTHQQIQMGAEMVVMPDGSPIPSLNADGTINPSVTDYTPAGPTAKYPVVMAKFYLGNLGLSQGPQNVNALDTEEMEPYYADGHSVPILMGQTLSLPLPGPNGTVQNFSVSFPSLHMYAFFMVSKDPGVPFIYLGFTLIMAGLLSKLYLKPYLEYRQRRARQARGGDDDSASAEVTGRRVEEPRKKSAPDHEPRGVESG